MNQLEEQFKSVKATIEMEGMEVSDEVQRIVLKEARGEISFHEFKKQDHETAAFVNNHTSSYCYPGTDVLINLFDIRDAKDLELMEVAYTARRLLTLQNRPVKGAFDLEHLQAIHRYIFQDIFPFAGEIRTENIGKGTFSFANARFIVTEANCIFRELKEENYLEGLLRNGFAKRAAYYMAEINVLHPFREGNGRAQREFIRCLAGRSGYRLDWNLVDNETKMTASVQSKTKIDELASVIGNCIQNEIPDDRFAQTFL